MISLPILPTKDSSTRDIAASLGFMGRGWSGSEMLYPEVTSLSLYPLVEARLPDRESRDRGLLAGSSLCHSQCSISHLHGNTLQLFIESPFRNLPDSELPGVLPRATNDFT